MKKNIFILFVLFFYTAKAQEDVKIDSLKYRIDYVLSYQNDSTDVHSKDQEEFILMVGKEKSLFVSSNTYKRDSIKNEMFRSRNVSGLNLSNVPKSSFSYRILKNLYDKSVSFHDVFFRTPINYQEKMNLDWQITKDKEKIENLDCGIAYVNYGGRRFKTWYALEIPIAEGPYKFFGLPGLIVKMEDTKGYYKFELSRFKDVSNQKELIVMEKRLLNGKTTTKQDFLSAKINYINNMGEELMKSGIMIGNDAIKKAQDRERKKNNPIELY